MFDLFQEYKTETESKPFKVKDWVGKDGKQIERERIRALTYDGFDNFCYERVGDVSHYFENTEGRYAEYGGVCSRIKKIIRQFQIEAGLADQINTSITQRLNNLKDGIELDHGGAVKILNNDPLA